MTRDDLGTIVDIQLRHLVARMADRRITLEVSNDAKLLLADKGYDPSFGARPLKRLIQREIADRAAVLILEGKAGEDSTIRVDARDGDLLVSV